MIDPRRESAPQGIVVALLFPGPNLTGFNDRSGPIPHVRPLCSVEDLINAPATDLLQMVTTDQL